MRHSGTRSECIMHPIFAMVVDFIAFDHLLNTLQFVGSAAILIAAAGMTLGWPLIRTRSLRV